ncbi:MAG: SGNH/GDSL hydrolase family protein [bacterium]
MKPKFLLYELIIITTALVLACLIGEGITRKFFPFPQTPPIREFDSNLGIERLRKNIDGFFKLDNAYLSSFHINSQRMRENKEYNYTKDKQSFRILGLGDSFTFGLWVNSEDTYLKAMERMLNSNIKPKKFEVINAGVPQYGTVEELIFLENEGKKFNPDLIIVGFYVNDVEENARNSNFTLKDGVLTKTKQVLYEHSSHNKIKEFSQNIPVYCFLSQHSQMFNRMRIQIGELLYYRKLYSDLTKNQNIPQDMQREEYNWELTRAILLKMGDVAQSINAKLLIVIIPPYETLSTIKLDADNHTPAYVRLMPIISKDVYILDLPPGLFVKSKDRLYYKNDFHWTGEGHRIGAEGIFDYLLVHKELLSL